MIESINIEKALDHIRDNAEPLAIAKAQRVYLEQFRKSKKAMLVLAVESGTIQEKDAYAYSHPEYQLLLESLKVAVEEEEKLRWLMIAAQAKIDVWRSQNANNRYIDKAHT